MLKKIMLFFAGLTMASIVASAGDNILPYQLKSGKPYAGTTLNILAVVTPQFKAYELRDEEFESLTGIKLNWTHTPFVALQSYKRGVGPVQLDPGQTLEFFITKFVSLELGGDHRQNI